MRPVDKQVQLLYGAQWAAFKESPLDSPLGMTECVGMTNTLFTRARVKGYWFSGYTPPVTYSTKEKLGSEHVGRAVWYTDRAVDSFIVLAPEGKRGWIIAHEIAHLLLMAGRSKHALLEFHGKEYAAVYIWTVSALFGIRWSNRLKRAFAEAHVEAVCSLKED